MAFLDMAAAFLVGALGGMGIGGGTLLVIYLSLLHRTPQLAVQGTNLIFFLFSAGAALPFHLKRRRLPLSLLALCTAAALPMAVFGSLLSGVIAEALVRKLFAWLLILSGSLVLFRPAGKESASAKIPMDFSKK